MEWSAPLHSGGLEGQKHKRFREVSRRLVEASEELCRAG